MTYIYISGGRGAGQPNEGPPVSQAENSSGGTAATENNPVSENNQLNETNVATNTNNVNMSPSQNGIDTENHEGGESTGGQPPDAEEGGSTGEQSAGAGRLLSTPMKIVSMAIRAGAGLRNTPRRILRGATNQMTGNVATEQGNEDREEGSTED